MSKTPLVMKIPKELATALSRRHNGREDITKSEILDAVSKMNLLYSQWKKALEKLEYCEGGWWDKMEVEKHFQESRWYYAHRKRKKMENEVKDLHREMFNLMIYTDGNYEPFDNGPMSVEEIVASFNSKYLKRLKYD